MKDQVNLIAKRIEPKDKLTSFKDLKREFKAFISPKGYSKCLGTNNPIKKLFTVLCMVTLFATCVFFGHKNYSGYIEYGVTTEIRNRENGSLAFPAVTLCLQTHTFTKSDGMIPQDLSTVFGECLYEKTITCSMNDFEYLPIYNSFFDITMNCYKFNGGRNASGHQVPILQATQFEAYSGLVMTFNMLQPSEQFLIYYVGDNRIKPLYSQLTKIVQPGKAIFSGIEKTVDIKLPEPYNSCKDDITAETSCLVKQILDQDITYTQELCYDLCLYNYAMSSNISKRGAYNSPEFNFEEECQHLCPQECSQVSFESEDTIFYYSGEREAELIWINFYFSDNSYTEITQSVKTSTSDLVSNTGGVLGLFLELSFISVYRLVVFLFDFVFV